MEITTRNPNKNEITALQQIWETVFGSDDAPLFFSHCFSAELCVVASHASAPIAAGYLLPAGCYMPGSGNKSIPASMIYGVATLPEYRGRGLGTTVVRSLISLSYELGYPAVALCPAEDSLFEYYSARTSLRDWFYIREERFVKPSIGKGGAKLINITPDEYAEVRSGFLPDIAHMVTSLRSIEYQSMLCAQYGGGLCRIDTPAGVACAIAEMQPGRLLCIKELFAPVGHETDTLSSIADAFHADHYSVRTPAPSPPAGASIRRFGMLTPLPGLHDAPDAIGFLPWLGPAFD